MAFLGTSTLARGSAAPGTYGAAAVYAPPLVKFAASMSYATAKPVTTAALVSNASAPIATAAAPPAPTYRHLHAGHAACISSGYGGARAYRLGGLPASGLSPTVLSRRAAPALAAPRSYAAAAAAPVVKTLAVSAPRASRAAAPLAITFAPASHASAPITTTAMPLVTSTSPKSLLLRPDIWSVSVPSEKQTDTGEVVPSRDAWTGFSDMQRNKTQINQKNVPFDVSGFYSRAESEITKDRAQPTIKGPLTVQVQMLSEGNGLRISCTNLAGAEVLVADFGLVEKITKLETSICHELKWASMTFLCMNDGGGDEEQVRKDQLLKNFTQLVVKQGVQIELLWGRFMRDGHHRIQISDSATLNDLYRECGTWFKESCEPLRGWKLRNVGDVTLAGLGLRDGDSVFMA